MQIPLLINRVHTCLKMSVLRFGLVDVRYNNWCLDMCLTLGSLDLGLVSLFLMIMSIFNSNKMMNLGLLNFALERLENKHIWLIKEGLTLHQTLPKLGACQSSIVFACYYHGHSFEDLVEYTCNIVRTIQMSMYIAREFNFYYMIWNMRSKNVGHGIVCVTHGLFVSAWTHFLAQPKAWQHADR